MRCPMTFVYAHLLECREKVQRLPRPIISDPYRVSELQKRLSTAQCVCVCVWKWGASVHVCTCLDYHKIWKFNSTKLQYSLHEKKIPFTCLRLQRNFVPLIKCYCFWKVELKVPEKQTCRSLWSICFKTKVKANSGS